MTNSAKKSKAKPKTKPARKAAPKRAAAKKAPAKKLLSRPAPKKAIHGKAKKAALRKAAPKKAAAKRSSRLSKSKKPVGHVPAARKAAVLARVARARPGTAHIDSAPVVPMAVEAAIPPAPVDHLHGNYGDSKARSVARNDNPTNWFRQAPKQKSK